MKPSHAACFRHAQRPWTTPQRPQNPPLSCDSQNPARGLGLCHAGPRDHRGNPTQGVVWVGYPRQGLWGYFGVVRRKPGGLFSAAIGQSGRAVMSNQRPVLGRWQMTHQVPPGQNPTGPEYSHPGAGHMTPNGLWKPKPGGCRRPIPRLITKKKNPCKKFYFKVTKG